jgi:hypothetical protein
MAFQEGNQWWKLRSKHGRDKLFASPELLLESAFEYFQWCDENPWEKTKTSSFDKGEFSGTSIETVPTQRPYSLAGWFLYIGCSDTWLKEFKKKASDDFLRVINEVELIIHKQQWEGATVGAFKENIIARTLGLKESNDITTNGKDLNLNPLTQEELKKASDSLDDV